MNETLQLAVVAACIAGAVVYLARRVTLLLRGKQAGCGTACGGCGEAEEGKQVVDLEPLSVNRQRESRE